MAKVNRLVREALAADKHAVPLAPSLKEAQSKAMRLLTQKTSPPLSPGKEKVREGKKDGLSLAEARWQQEQ